MTHPRPRAQIPSSAVLMLAAVAARRSVVVVQLSPRLAHGRMKTEFPEDAIVMVPCARIVAAP